MGWAGGSTVMSGIVGVFDSSCVSLSHMERVALYKGIIEVLQGEDWDCTDDCFGEDDALDEALEQVAREWCEENDEDFDELYPEGM